MSKEKRYYSHGLVPDSELRKDLIKGVAGIVVSKDGRILVGTEQTDKPVTKKKKGQISIPFETLKPKELKQEGGFVSALLTEITTRKIMPDLYKMVDSAGVIDQVEVAPDLWVATLLLRFNGKSDSMPFEAQHPQEFSDLKWMGVKTLLNDPNIRPFAVPVLESALEINRTRPNGINFRQLYLEAYMPDMYEQAREMEKDLEIGLVDAMSTLITMDGHHHR